MLYRIGRLLLTRLNTRSGTDKGLKESGLNICGFLLCRVAL